MGASNYKHEIKTLFLVINSFMVLTIGLYPLALGLGMLLAGARARAPGDEVVILGYLAVGTLTLCLAALGHYGAFVEKRAVLRVYGGVSGLVTLVLVIAVFQHCFYMRYFVLISGTFNIGVMLFATILAMILAKQCHWTYPVQPATLAATAPAPAPTAPTAL